MNVLVNHTLAPRKVLRVGVTKAENRSQLALEKVGLLRHYRSNVTQPSGGEHQLIATTRALMIRPRMLLCDGITCPLDPRVAAEVLGVLTRLKDEEELTVALLTHDMAFASEAADRVVFFDDGRIAVNRTPNEALESTQDEDLCAFVDTFHF